MNWFVFRSKTTHIQSKDLKILNKLEERNLFQNTLCGYSKLTSGNAWTAPKGINSIRPPSTEKKPKTYSILWIFKMIAQEPLLGCFLQTWWSDWNNSFWSYSEVSRRKFRVPTKSPLVIAMVIRELSHQKL